MPKMSMNPFCEIALEVGCGAGPGGTGMDPQGKARTSRGAAGQLQRHKLRGTKHVFRVGHHHPPYSLHEGYIVRASTHPT